MNLGWSAAWTKLWGIDMVAKLVAEEGSLKGLILSLEGSDQWVIGRDPDVCQLLVEDPSASRKHLICRTTPNGILVENLSTTNPVEINKEKVETPRLLQNGDSVKIGSGIFRFYADPLAKIQDEASQTGSKTEEKSPDQNNAEKNESNDHPSPEPNPQVQDPPMSPEEKKIIPEGPSAPATDLAEPRKEQPRDDEPRHDSIFTDAPSDDEKHNIAEINFGLLDTGRWLLKVLSGPNNGAEFSMQSGNSYLVGSDPNACDIIFHDTSISRQHARITISKDDVLTIEDLKSRNGTLIDGQTLKGKQTLKPNTMVSIGTSSFVVYDREGAMQTIISPLMPSIVKVLQAETPKEFKKEEEKSEAEKVEAAPVPEIPPVPETHPSTTIGALILIAILTALLVIIGVGTSTLFHSEPIAVVTQIDPTQLLDSALASFPSVKYTFNSNTGQLLLVGHVLTVTDKNQLLYSIRGMPFIKHLDDGGVIIDEYVWREIDQVLDKNPEWKGINVMSSAPGHFVVSGYLKTAAESDRLTEYLNANFPYPDLLENKVVVEQEIVTLASAILQSNGLKNVTAKLDNGELILAGGVPSAQTNALATAILKIKEVRGIRSVRNITVVSAPEESVVNISSSYEVSGISSEKNGMSVIINGRILMTGDSLDGMTITSIQSNTVNLEKDGIKYRIDFSL
ncbi:MAG: type III secretion system inner membrane ring subunit SctD [Parachlamydiaceae bacterium]